MLKKLRFVIGLLISAAFLFLAFRKVDLHEVLKILKHIRLFYLLIGVCITVCVIYIRAKRWKIIMGERGSAFDVMKYFESLSVGQMMNNVLPFRIGDIGQAYFFGFITKSSRSMAFSTVVMERLFDLVPPFLVIIAGSFFIMLPKQIGIDKILLVIAVGFAVLAILFRSKKRLKIIIEKIVKSDKLKNSMHKLIDNFYCGLSIIKQKDALLKIVAYTTVIWSVYFALMYICLLSLDIHLSIPAAILVMAIISFSVIIPSSPGFIGTWELCAIIGLGIFRVNKHLALTFALIYHLVSLVPVTLMGFSFFIKSGASFTEVEKEAEEQEQESKETPAI
jgi:glycosyltransferase 2 family protein